MHFLSRAAIAAQVREPKSVMPPVHASVEEIENLLAYLSRLDQIHERTGLLATGVALLAD